MLALQTAVRKVERLAYSPDGTRLAVGGPTGTEVIEVAGGETVVVLEWAYGGPLAFGGDSDTLLIARGNNLVAFIDLSYPETPTANEGFIPLTDAIHLLPVTGEWFVGLPHRVLRRKSVRTWYSDSLDNATVWEFNTFHGNVHPRRLTAFDNPSA